ALKDLRLVDDRLLADEFPAVAFHRDHLWRVHRAHDLEVLPLVAQIHEFIGDCLNAHGDLLCKRKMGCGDSIAWNDNLAKRFEASANIGDQRIRLLPRSEVTAFNVRWLPAS